jgi:hypothetical membrane protein
VTPERRWAIGRIATTAGILSAGTVAFGVLVAAPAYQGTAGEAYSPLNHWISELGQVGVSARASAFNLALVAAGMEFVMFMVGLAQTSPSRLRWAFGPIGAVAGLGGALVGMFPMNHPTEHLIAAAVFFDLAWIAVGLASITFVRHPEPRFPRWLAGLGALTVVAFVAFLVSLQVDDAARARMAASGPISGRPEVWIAPILEWATLASILLWTLCTSLTWRRTLGSRARARARS